MGPSHLLLTLITIFFIATTRTLAAWNEEATFETSGQRNAPLSRDHGSPGLLTSFSAPPHAQNPLYPDESAGFDAEQGGDAAANGGTAASIHVLAEMRQALNVMQSSWFELWLGTWPTAIDWTAAVLNTHLIVSLHTISKATADESPWHEAVGVAGNELRTQEIENELNLFFSQTIAYHFNENAFSIRNEAYDDMSWVILGWLESIKFTRAHNGTQASPWHGLQFINVFAHRARVFYELITKGWDTELCGGGMVWDPSLGPYKNAITNQLYISASVDMYLYHPGDANESPFFLTNNDGSRPGRDSVSLEQARPQDPAYLKAAIKGYDWLKSSNMTNALGLYVDGFHITGWRRDGSLGTKKCDARNEQVFTYTQAVVLSGLRGLWESTGNRSYLEDGHELIRNSISATGWSVVSNSVLDSDAPGKWRGLGRNGILEDRCDSRGTCDQDAHTFKGIFFHHLALFCQPLPSEPLIPGKTFAASIELASLHWQSCQSYTPWVAHNAGAALSTRDEQGKFGNWWGAQGYESGEAEVPPTVEGAIDYRNDPSVLAEELWQGTDPEPDVVARDPRPVLGRMLNNRGPEHGACKSDRNGCDPNKRGRGRTVESHSGGLAVLRCLWELEHLA